MRAPFRKARMVKLGLNSKRVAIIGAGPAGLACARFLREKGHVPTVFEASSCVGGVWAKTPLNRVVYPSLRTNIPTCVMQSKDLQFQDGLPSFVDKEAACTYFEDYAQHFDLLRMVRFNCTVHRVRCVHQTVQWEVVCSTPEKDRDETLVFDAVAVANGHYEEEAWPDIPGLSDWLNGANSTGRELVHSKSYRDPELFAGKSVLIVGAKSSGMDIAREIKDTVSSLYVADSTCKALKTRGNLTVIPRGVSIREDGGVVFDGSRVSGLPVEVVISAAGYVYSFPFLDENELGMSFKNQKRVLPVYQHIVHARIPSLAFIGLPKNPCPLRLFEAQSMYVAAFWSGEITTTEAERLRWVQEHLETVSPREQDFHTFSDRWGSAWEYLKDLVIQVPGIDYEEYCSNLNVAEEVYATSATKKPELPWNEDTYRDWNYHVDWDQGTFTSVSKPKRIEQSRL